MTCTKCGGCLEQTRLDGENEMALHVSIPAIRCINCGMYWYHMASNIEHRVVSAIKAKRSNVRDDTASFNFVD